MDHNNTIWGKNRHPGAPEGQKVDGLNKLELENVPMDHTRWERMLFRKILIYGKKRS